MFSPTRRGRALELWVAVLMLAGTACGAGMPAAPVSMPLPVAAPAEPSAMRRQKTPKTPKAPKTKQRPPEPKALPASRKATPASPRTPRAVRVDSAALERAVTKAHAHWPLAIALARRSGNPEVAEQAAVALVREAERLRLSPSLLGAVLLIENTPLDPTAVSSQGAIGLMQVMPIHRGSYGCFADLVNVDTNICHGASILKHMVRRTNSVSLALKRYNGCVRGRNTPRCYRYPVRVLRTASRLRREMLLAAADTSLVLQEVLAATPRRSSGGRQLVTSPDSSDSEGEGSSITCASFFGCLRDRWTARY
ncbi:MAG TPA: lytic transglycosylase domain-containing protein [Gemmatimonadales bacterium]|nr:lytic transglycosylase domain-containing protein [Gemmatimonadales bacterium]